MGCSALNLPTSWHYYTTVCPAHGDSKKKLKEMETLKEGKLFRQDQGQLYCNGHIPHGYTVRNAQAFYLIATSRMFKCDALFICFLWMKYQEGHTNNQNIVTKGTGSNVDYVAR